MESLVRKALIILAAAMFAMDYIVRGSERRTAERMVRMASMIEQRLAQLEGDVAGFNEATNQIAAQLQQDQGTIADLRQQLSNLGQQLATANQGQADVAALDDRLAKLHESLSGKVIQLQQLGTPPQPVDQPSDTENQPPKPVDQPSHTENQSQPVVENQPVDQPPKPVDQPVAEDQPESRPVAEDQSPANPTVTGDANPPTVVA